MFRIEQGVLLKQSVLAISSINCPPLEVQLPYFEQVCPHRELFLPVFHSAYGGI